MTKTAKGIDQALLHMVQTEVDYRTQFGRLPKENLADCLTVFPQEVTWWLIKLKLVNTK